MTLAQPKENDYYPESVKDSISVLSKLLSSDWILEGYYINDKYEERKLSTFYGENDTCESLVQTKKGIVKVTKKRGEIVRVDSTNYQEIISFSFSLSGIGSYDHKLESINSDIEEIFTNYISLSPSFPEIIYAYEKYFVKFTDSGGESCLLIHIINKEMLVFISERSERIKYRKKNYAL